MSTEPDHDTEAEQELESRRDARAVCEHFYASHCYRGMSIRLCAFCHDPDWDDLERQLAISDLRAGTEPEPGSSGVAMIRAERARQIAAEGYTAEHDTLHHHDGQLARAAGCYALYAAGVRQIGTYRPGESWPWPWTQAFFKPGDGPLAALVKAGALIAAEIDRLIDNG